jgi:GGDEF domain-containing protein
MASASIERVGGRFSRYDLTAIPQDGGVLVLARDVTKESGQIATLKASREMFRDVALCAGGFAFETDDKGLFSWVGPGAPLGHASHNMIGRAAQEFILPQSPAAFDPLSTRDIVEDIPVWANSLDQGPRALRMTVRPYFGPNGQWRGVRGHARDETSELRFARRDRFAQAAIEAIRIASGPQALLQAVAVAAAEVCQTRAAWLFGADPAPRCVSTPDAIGCELLNGVAGRILDEGVQYPALFSVPDWTGLGVALKAQGEVQGVLLVALPSVGGEVGRDLQEMLRLIAPHASVAALHARTMARVQIQNVRDPLTGMLTSNGWRERLEAKLNAGAAGHVMAVECDRFKAFGDGLGRAASDELLIEIGHSLSGLSGPGEFCARIGEATFALWIDGEGEAALAARADAVTEAFRIASRRMSLALAASPIVASAAVAKNTLPAHAAALTAKAVDGLASAKRPARVRGTPPCSKT